VYGAPGGRGVGPAARAVALMARKTGANPAGAAALLAWPKRRPSRARGVRGRASRRGRDTLAGRPLEPVRLASGHGVGRRSSQRGRACRRARPARGSPLVCLCRRRRGGHQRRGRPGAGTAGPHAPPLALSGSPLSGGSRQPPKKRTRRGRPPKTEVPQVEVRDRLVVRPEALRPSEDAQGWTVLATTLR